MKITVCFLVIAISGAFSLDIELNPLSDEYINFINSQQSTWTAGRNFDENTSLFHLRKLLGALKPTIARSAMNVLEHDEDTPIPESFDARQQWPGCQYINFIRDQSFCGSCWAVSSASVMTDRICIHSNGKKQIYVSDQDILTCCVNKCGAGCSGGAPLETFNYWHETGIVSGGPYNSTKGCRSYFIPPCNHDSTGKSQKPDCTSLDFDRPECHFECDEKSSLSYESDKSFGQYPYYVPHREKQIQLEILKNGPVVATFPVYYDFYSYESGIYQRISNTYAGYHAVRVLGWGSENGSPYWLVANSWDDDWGENGLFKILRGKNGCNFEEEMVAGLPI